MKDRIEELFHEVVDLSPQERARYFARCHIDPATCREVEALVTFDSRSGATWHRNIREVAHAALEQVEPKSLLCGPYRLLNLLGRGGMGSVYSAEPADQNETQRVAVKILLPGSEDARQRERFYGEQQILASLSHPNIARLLKAGHREDGLPYLAMEYVEGRAIDDYAAGLSIREKVTLFLKVCGAVSYLHRNLVVHRDLKPANILVTEEGEPKLLDFGIAKLLGLPTDLTATCMRALTPDYASPEQVTGGAITTATDIYSLGAVFYKVLTGASPHRFENDSPEGMISGIAYGKIIPPSWVVPDLRGDLEFILMKALRKEPQERYGSVDALAEDLRAFLESRPVLARSSDFWYQTRKLLQRYWVPAAVTVVVIASLSAGLYIANRQREVAERRFAQLRQLSTRVFDLDRAISRLPGSVEARKRLVAASLEYLEGLSRETEDDLDLAKEVAEGYWRLGRIEGVNAEFNLGDSSEAERCLKKADALIENVLKSRPKDRIALLRSALIAHDRMIVAYVDGRRADVPIHAGEAVNRLETFLRKSSPRDIRESDLLATGDAPRSGPGNVGGLFVNIAINYLNVHMYEEGARYARRAVEIGESLPSADKLVIEGLSVLANALRYQGDLQGALSAIRQARKLSEQANYPNAAARVFNLYGPTYREGLILGEPDMVNLGRPAEAAAVLQKALDMTEEVARTDLNDTSTRVRLADAAWNLGDLLRDEDPRRALAVYDHGILRAGETKNNRLVRRQQAGLLAKSSYVLRRLHRPAEAKERIREATAILQETGDYPAQRIRLDNFAYVLVSSMADDAAETGQKEEAHEIYEDLLQKVMAWPPEPEVSLPDAVSLARLYKLIAGLDRSTGRIDVAATLDAKRVALWRHWAARLPSNDFVQRQLQAATRDSGV
jgi:serine/threonine protein kinase